MREKGKWLYAAFVLLMCAGLILGGCASKNEEPSGEKNSSEAQPTQEGSNPVETANDPLASRLSLSLGFWGSGGWGNDQWYEDLSQKFNVDIKFTNLDWSDWDQKIRLMATSGELPDFTAGPLPSNDYLKFAQQGVLKAIPDDLSAYPHLQSYLNADVINSLKVDGKLYAIPRALTRDLGNIVPAYKIVYRKDWLVKLGIPEPQTYEEFLDMNRQFVEKKLGGKDTVGYTNFALADAFYPFLHGMGQASDSWELVDGTWVPGLMNKKNVEWLRLLREYYKLGAIDPDFAINKSSFGNDKFTGGIAGSAIMGLSAKDYENLLKNFETSNPGLKGTDAIGLLMYPKNPKGEMQIAYDIGIGTGTFFNANLSDEKMDRILRMMDYFLSDEGLKFGFQGVEGRDYKIEGDTVVLTTPVDEETNLPKSIDVLYPTSGMKSISYWLVDYSKIDKTIPQAVRDEVSKYEDTLANQGVRESRNLQIDFMSTPAKDKWNYGSIFYEGFTKLVLSNDDVEKMFNDTVQKARANGGNDAIKEVNEKLASME